MTLESDARGAIFGLLVCVAALLACGGGAEWTRVGARTYAIECDGTRECHQRAHRLCPYGYKVKEQPSRDDLLVTCAPPVFCSNQGDCAAQGLRCVKSKRYPGRGVCADQ